LGSVPAAALSMHPCPVGASPRVTYAQTQCFAADDCSVVSINNKKEKKQRKKNYSQISKPFF